MSIFKFLPGHLRHTFYTIAFCSIALTALGQGWKSEIGGNAFDGEYITAFVQGKSTSSSYKAPLIVLNKFEGSQINFYLAGAGYFQEGTGVSIQWIFDGDKDKMFSTYDWSYSADGKSLFIEEINHPTYLTTKMNVEAFLKYFQECKTLDIRISNNYSKVDLSFSLSGFTKASSQIITTESIDSLHSQFFVDAERRDSLLLKKIEFMAAIAANAKVKYGLTDRAYDDFTKELERKLGLETYNLLPEKEILFDSIYAVPDSSVLGWDKKKVEIYSFNRDGSNERIGLWYDIETTSSIISEYEKKQEAFAKRENDIKSKIYKSLNPLNTRDSDLKSFEKFNEYERHMSLKDEVYKFILDEYEGPFGKKNFNLKKIQSVKVDLSSSSKWNVTSCNISLFLTNGESRKTFVILDDPINKVVLKTIGHQGGDSIQINF
jgi:hypothetical protein